MPKVVSAEERLRKRRTILDAAAAEIARFGYERANINTIAEQAGIGRGTIYLYFESKEEILNALLDTIGTMIDDIIRTCLECAEPWPDRLRHMCQAFVQLAEEHRDFFRVQVSALHGVNRDVGAPLARWLRLSADRLTEAFALAHHQGEIQAPEPEALAVLMLGMWESLALLPDALLRDASSRVVRADALANLLWRGMIPAD